MTGWTVVLKMKLLGEHGHAMLSPFDVPIADKGAALDAVLVMFPNAAGIEVHSIEPLLEAQIAELGLTTGKIQQR